MKKEVFIAIITGLTLGLVISLAIYYARNQAVPENVVQSQEELTQNQANTVDEVEQLPKINITTPANFALLDTQEVAISGQAEPNVYLTAVTTSSEAFTQATSNGNFSLRIKLLEGVNIVTITATSADGSQESVDLTLTYLSNQNGAANEE